MACGLKGGRIRPASLAVLDPQGRLAGLVRPPFNAPAIARDLQKLTEKSAP